MALLPVKMFARELQQGRLAQPFAQELHRGAYWLTRLQSRPATGAMTAFRDWLLAQASAGAAHRGKFIRFMGVVSLWGSFGLQVQIPGDLHIGGDFALDLLDTLGSPLVSEPEAETMSRAGLAAMPRALSSAATRSASPARCSAAVALAAAVLLSFSNSRALLSASMKR